MKKFGRLKLFRLGIILTIALVFMGINVLKAKKPVPWKWEVMLPSVGGDQTFNLYGDNIPYIDNDTDIHVEVTEGRSAINRDRVNKFLLAIYDTSGRFVGFKNLTLTEKSRDENLPYCQFPDCSDCVNSDTCCMECFLEENLHPSSGYIYFSLVIELDDDFEDMEIEVEPAEVFGFLRINVVKTWECLAEDSEEYHNVSCFPYTSTSGQGLLGCNIDIQRVNENIWTISADIPDLRVDEHYRVYLGGSRGKGGKGKGPGDNKYPLRTTTPFKFTTTWTRSLPQ